MDNLKHTHSNPCGNATGIFYFKNVLLFLLCAFSFNYFAQPRIQAEDLKKNFGHVKRGTVVKEVYDLFNAGSEPLIIKDAEVSCSCTTVEFPKHPVDPGKHAKVTVIFNTATVYGRQDREVLLHSNDPRSPLKLRYKGTVSQK